MNKELFRETEEKIYRYFTKDSLTKSLNTKLKLLENQIDTIKNDLKTCNVCLEIESSSPSFEQKVQTSSDGTSYAERETMRITDYRVKRMSDKLLEREKILEQLDQIELDYSYINDAIKPIKGTYQELLKMRYEKQMGETQIGIIMNWSQSQINKKKFILIKLIAGWDQWKKVL